MLIQFYADTAYRKCSPLPNTKPKGLQSTVYITQTGVLEKIRGSNLNRRYPKHEVGDLFYDKTYALGKEPELKVINLL